ncbi:MAG: hypothetical protein OXG90_13115 [Gammaproteobacteria bacterium]|nr:hypothetical protein [Gammaproteobacteria bacterium]
MTTEEFRTLLASWCAAEAEDSLSDDFSKIRSLTDFLEQVLYVKYEPAEVGNHGEFGVRLAEWIGSAESEADRRALYLLLGRLVFLSRDQMKAGYRTAYSRNIASWLMDVEGLPFFGTDTEARLNAAVEKTAFTEVTDSFGLANFLRWNNVAGHGSRFTWEQHLSTLDSNVFMQNVMRFGTGTPRRYLVLLEDFVGSGNQMAKAVHLACSLPNVERVLLCPIVICPDGSEYARELANRCGKLDYSPVMELPEEAFISEDETPDEHKHHGLIRNALLSVHTLVKGTPDSWPQETSAFGYEETGAVFCKFDNCPDNSVPVLHHRSDLGWSPLFQRMARDA